jgi:hypothetical protein
MPGMQRLPGHLQFRNEGHSVRANGGREHNASRQRTLYYR